MKFKRGVKVEVMNQAEVPISWRAAQILSEDGHWYTLRFDSLGESESVVERVYKSLIRPSPPLMQHTENWLPGDILEVFDDFSWKVAIVVHAVNEDYYFVRLIGSSHEFCIHVSSMRRRLAWQDGRWDWLSKGTAEYRKLKSNKLSNQICYRNTGYQLWRPDSVDRLEEFHVPSSRSLKRAYVHCSSTTGSHTPLFKKQRTLETDGQRQEILEKVEAVASYPRETLGRGMVPLLPD
ncbi:unnamed protein product [Cuscuta campestris]|uniref:Agenet domain-containing protein n=1 Tax=Cuscuta campestris TaxID=132261 RepID=A0A484NAW9_9ASTE|nr:unnamed protein product [Cuscuta campestris]